MGAGSHEENLSLLKTPDVKSSAIGMLSRVWLGRVAPANASVIQGDVILAEAVVAQAEAT